MQIPKINKNMYKNIPPVVTNRLPAYKMMQTKRKTKESSKKVIILQDI